MLKELPKNKVLLFDIEVAQAIGEKEALLLYQLRYWMGVNEANGQNLVDGRYWTFDSYPKWQERDFPHWSIDTVKRTFRKLEKMNLLISSQSLNKRGYDRTKWYTINFEAFEELMDNFRREKSEIEEAGKEISLPSVQTALTIDANCILPSGQTAPTIDANCTYPSVQIALMEEGKMTRPI